MQGDFPRLRHVLSGLEKETEVSAVQIRGRANNRYVHNRERYNSLDAFCYDNIHDSSDTYDFA